MLIFNELFFRNPRWPNCQNLVKSAEFVNPGGGTEEDVEARGVRNVGRG
jgi:hypothetical protein